MKIIPLSLDEEREVVSRGFTDNVMGGYCCGKEDDTKRKIGGSGRVS